MNWAIIVVMLLAGCGIVYGLRQKKKTQNSKVVKLSSVRRKAGKAAQQPCSLCKKKAARLLFYASENGQVIGVCDACKPQAERRELMRL